MKIALVHDWLFQMRGGERVLEHFCDMFPSAHIYTLFHRSRRLSPTIRNHTIHGSLLNLLPAVQNYYRYLLPLFPLAVHTVRIPADIEVVLSGSHCAAKAIPVPDGARHICYCHSPMRYLWHQFDLYFPRRLRESPAWEVLGRVVTMLREWDVATAANVDVFVANSCTVRDRIRSCYGRDAVVIYPPVDTNRYRPLNVPREDFYLCVSALVPYKRIDLAVEACRQLRRPLVVVGDGPLRNKLARHAPETVRFLGWVDEPGLLELYNRCRAVIFPALEDFGLVPVEAQACGTPVICYGKGGATETVIPPEAGVRPTGVWFEEQSVESLVEAIRCYERLERWFDPAALRANAARFGVARFREAFYSLVCDRAKCEAVPQRLAA